MFLFLLCCLAILTSGVTSQEENNEDTSQVLKPDEIRNASNEEVANYETPNTAPLKSDNSMEEPQNVTQSETSVINNDMVNTESSSSKLLNTSETIPDSNSTEASSNDTLSFDEQKTEVKPNSDIDNETLTPERLIAGKLNLSKTRNNTINADVVNGESVGAEPMEAPKIKESVTEQQIKDVSQTEEQREGVSKIPRTSESNQELSISQKQNRQMRVYEKTTRNKNKISGESTNNLTKLDEHESGENSLSTDDLGRNITLSETAANQTSVATIDTVNKNATQESINIKNKGMNLNSTEINLSQQEKENVNTKEKEEETSVIQPKNNQTDKTIVKTEPSIYQINKTQELTTTTEDPTNQKGLNATAVSNETTTANYTIDEANTEIPDSNKSAIIDRPNIVFIVADDLGWDDVSFHGSDQIMTPNIDTIAYQSIILHNYYTDTLGTSSRSAMFTGKYPLRLGTQGASIKAFEDRGIPISERLMPDYLQELGYKTHLIGKWGVGKSRKYYVPNNRGFETFYGFLGGSVDYFTYNAIESFNNTAYYGLDLFENESPLENLTGHLTDLLTERAKQVIREHNSSSPLYLHLSHAAPHCGGGLVNLQPPADVIDENHHIAHSARRLYADLVTSLDRSVGHIVSALAERDILKNTLIIFVSDNGAPSEGQSQNFGSNLPLRGMKDTPWEGGARATAFLWHHALQPEIRRGLFHVTDWLPTLVAAAGGNVNGTIDGINQWEAIIQKQPKRNELLISIDDEKGWVALRDGDFKMIVGDVSKDISRHFGADYQALRQDPPVYEKMLLECETYYVLRETLSVVLNIDEASMKRNEINLLNHNTSAGDRELCFPTSVKGCLFNITEDPLEINDLWATLPEITKQMSLRLRTLWTELKPRAKPQGDPRCDPALHNYIWAPWVPNNESLKQPLTSLPPFPLQVSINELQYLVDLNMDMFKEKMYESIRNMGNSFMKTVGGLFGFAK